MSVNTEKLLEKLTEQQAMTMKKRLEEDLRFYTFASKQQVHWRFEEYKMMREKQEVKDLAMEMAGVDTSEINLEVMSPYFFKAHVMIVCVKMITAIERKYNLLDI